MDIAIAWNSAGAFGDWVALPGDLATTGGLLSAVLVSLFTDRLASADYLPPDPNAVPDKRGWWGDTYEPHLLGSRLWQLNRSKKTNSTTLLAQAQDYCMEALQWLIDDGIAAAVAVNTQWLTRDAIGIAVQITPPTGFAAQNFQFSWAWGGIF